jgi:CRP-like cAMP-binding protein
MTNISRYTLNSMLAALPAEAYGRISPLLTVATLKPHQALQKRGEPLREIFFPSQSLTSLVLTTTEGASAEIAVVGSEGIVGIEIVLGLGVAMCDATVQVAGEGVVHSMNVDAFRMEFERGGALHDQIRKYAQAFMGFLTQSVACNALHAVEARCCRWLLNADDRLGGGEFPVTHELLSAMLGVRRPTITLVMSALAQIGAISASRGAIRIVDRDSLEARACGCYGIVRRFFDDLLPTDVKRSTEYGDSCQPPAVFAS